MKRFRLYHIINGFILLGLMAVLASCGNGEDKGDDDGFNIRGIVIPSKVEIAIGEKFTFRGDGFLVGDKLKLAGNNTGKEFTVDIATEGSQVSFVVPAGFETDTYRFNAMRGNAVKAGIGLCQIEVISRIEIPDKEGMNIKGAVFSNAVGVPNVVVSDGVEVTVTDENGIYYLNSAKKYGYVFISIPGGYEAISNGPLPVFYKNMTSANVNTKEQHNFSLTAADNDEHVVLAMADLHLARRTNDLAQFANGFVRDAQALITDARAAGKKIYALTLGDIIWDQYWYVNSYGFSNYVQEVNVLGIPVFNTMGNHDYDYLGTGDWETATPWRKSLGPTYYSFNLGKAHYIVVDNMICTNNGTIAGRGTDTKIDNDQMAWLSKDLAHVSKDTPVFVAMHIPVNNMPSVNNAFTFRMSNGSDFYNLLKDYKEVHILTGHTHINYNAVRTSGENIFYEHNTAAVCATWWWTGNTGYAGNHTAPDGAPGGYGVWELSGKDVIWTYKGIQKSKEYQFRTYDLNKTILSPEVWTPSANDENKSLFASATYAGEYQVAQTNKVLINIWDWDPEWEITVTEGESNVLTPVRVVRKDPLHLISYPAQRLNRNSGVTFSTTNATHMFEVQATTATEPITIVVKDRFDREYREVMTRPKEMSTSMQ